MLANSGKKALFIMTHKKYISKIDLIFLDMMMPGISGLDVLKFMRDSNIQISTVLQIGIVDDRSLKKAMKLGVIARV